MNCFRCKILFLCMLLMPSMMYGQPVWKILSLIRDMGRSGSPEAMIKAGQFVDSLSKVKRVPYADGDSLLLIYKGNGSTTEVSWVGDFNGWKSGSEGFRGKRVDGTTIWVCQVMLPADARIDYKIVDGSRWMLDSLNSGVQYSGWGPNSEIRMPGYQQPDGIEPGPGVKPGKQSHYILMSKKMKGVYPVAFDVYVPYGVESARDVSVLYVLDGEDYADPPKGALLQIVDNLNAGSVIRPLIVVLIDPCNPGHPDQNRRENEYAANKRYLAFLADELVPFIDSAYHTNPDPSARCLMGVSMGGWMAAYVGLHRSDVFGNLVLHSPTFDTRLIRRYARSPMLPLRIFMSDGVFFDTHERCSMLADILENKHYDFKYLTLSQGHSWGNWKGTTGLQLQWIFHR